MKGVVRFGKKEKLSPCYVGHYYILQRFGKVVYELRLPRYIYLVHPIFHVSMLKKWIGKPKCVLFTKGLGVDKNLSYEEIPVKILDRQVKKLRDKEVASGKVLWMNHFVKRGICEAEAYMRSRYPNLFGN